MYGYKARGINGKYQTKEEIENQDMALADLDKMQKDSFRREKKRYLQTFIKLIPSLKDTLKEKYRKHGAHDKAKNFLTRELVFSAIVAEDVVAYHTEMPRYAKVVANTRKQMFQKEELESIISGSRNSKTSDKNYQQSINLLNAVLYIFSVLEKRDHINARTYIKINSFLNKEGLNKKTIKLIKKTITPFFKNIKNSDFSLPNLFKYYFQVFNTLGNKENNMPINENKKTSFLFLNLILMKYGYGCFLLRRNNKRYYGKFLKVSNVTIEYYYTMYLILYQSMCILRDILVPDFNKGLATYHEIKKLKENDLLSYQLEEGQSFSELHPVSYTLNSGYPLYDWADISAFKDKYGSK